MWLNRMLVPRKKAKSQTIDSYPQSIVTFWPARPLQVQLLERCLSRTRRTRVKIARARLCFLITAHSIIESQSNFRSEPRKSWEINPDKSRDWKTDCAWNSADNEGFPRINRLCMDLRSHTMLGSFGVFFKFTIALCFSSFWKVYQ